MTGFARVLVFLAGILVTGQTGTVMAAEVEVEVESGGVQPIDVRLVSTGEALRTFAKGDNNTYQISIADGGVAAKEYAIICRFNDRNQEIVVRTSATTPPTLSLMVFHKREPATLETLERLDGLGGDYFSLLERYFVARDVYWRAPEQVVPVRNKAMRIWYDAAFELARGYNFIAPDRKVKELADAEGGGYYKYMNEQFVALSWREVAKVADLRKKKEFVLAAQLNEYFLEEFKKLSDEDVQIVTKLQGINEELLTKNAEFFSTRLGL